MTWGHVVVATDGPGPGMHALQVATELSRRASVRLTLVTVLRPGESVPSALRPHEPLVLRGDPGIEIARYAEDSHADVIVLGRRAIRYGREYDLGPTAEAVVRRARVPCLLIPEGQRDFAHVVAALDGTERGWAVLDEAQEVRRLLGSDLELVTVEPLGDGHPLPRARTLRLSDELGHRGPAADPPLPALQIRWGEPVAVLRAELRHPGSDLLVVGSRRGGPRGVSPQSTGVGRALLHSVLSAILTVPL